ncbi:MAG TPA: CHAD domain-containing protein [Kofleriaceae bacterium]|nr:CHAD domain-containing protein [Kofleriaceae bacterium]
MPTTGYREEDKLGPLGAKVSAIYDASELRKTLVRAFAAAVQDAKDAANEVEHGPTKAVHDARKALRRARAVLELVAGALPKHERSAVRKALQEARRALSTARDHAVAPDTAGELALGEEDRGTARRVLELAAEAVPAMSELKQLVAESAARAAAQLEALEAALPQELAWEVVVDGLAGTYAEARRARRAGKRSKPWFHTWRRRSKELTYQLDLLAEHAGPRLAAIHSEIEGVTDTMSPAVDLIMLRDFVTTYAQGIPPADIDHLKSAIEAQLSDLMKEARRAGRDSFRQGSRKFRKRLTKAVHRDLTPLEAEPNGEMPVG